MSRKRRILLELLLLIFLIFLYLRGSQSYLTAEGMLHANERGLHYGPSKEVVLKHRNGSNVLCVGLVDHRTLSVIQGKKWGPLYRLRGGFIRGCFQIQEGRKAEGEVYNVDGGILLGMVDMEAVPGTVYVRFCAEKGPRGDTEELWEVPVLEGGFFWTESGTGSGTEPEDMYYVSFIEGYDAGGNLLFLEDFKKLPEM